jgi:hypothetical protein
MPELMNTSQVDQQSQEQLLKILKLSSHFLDSDYHFNQIKWSQ